MCQNNKIRRLFIVAVIVSVGTAMMASSVLALDTNVSPIIDESDDSPAENQIVKFDGSGTMIDYGAIDNTLESMYDFFGIDIEYTEQYNWYVEGPSNDYEALPVDTGEEIDYLFDEAGEHTVKLEVVVIAGSTLFDEEFGETTETTIHVGSDETDHSLSPENPLSNINDEPVDSLTAIQILDDWRDGHEVDGEPISPLEMIEFLDEWRDA